MKILEKIKNIKLKQIVQGEKNENRKALKTFKWLNYDTVQIRELLVELNRINVSALSNGHDISASTLTNTLKGRRNNALAKELIARALNLRVPELFPDNGSAPPASGN